MRIRADKTVCTGAGNCVRIAPDWFDQSVDDGIVVILNEDPPNELAELMRDVVDACPTGAIDIEPN
jgi:ferredoxin